MGVFNKDNAGPIMIASAKMGQICGELLKAVGRKDYVAFLKDVKIVLDEDIEMYSTDMIDEEIMKKQMSKAVKDFIF